RLWQDRGRFACGRGCSASRQASRHRSPDNRPRKTACRDLSQKVQSTRHRGGKLVPVRVGRRDEGDKGEFASGRIESRGGDAGPCLRRREVCRSWARYHRRGAALRGGGEGETLRPGEGGPYA